jgi:hypothetical protein
MIDASIMEKLATGNVCWAAIQRYCCCRAVLLLGLLENEIYLTVVV